MAIELIHHYALQNIPTIYDEEALTVMELCARTATKCNEVVTDQNKLRVDTERKIEELFDEGLPQHVDNWLERHPEATTTVQDASLTEEKFMTPVRLKKASYFPTVADMVNDESLIVGMTAVTAGYHTPSDNGGNMYAVISEAVKPYDIPGNGMAFRPVAAQNITPKQFGTVNNGEDPDNLALQACFDFAADYNVSTIDGLNLTYYVDSSTDAGIGGHGDYRGYGVSIKKGVTLKNYRGTLLPSAGEFTSVLHLLQAADNHYLLENCTFDGKYGTVAETTTGMFDGGMHCLMFTYEDKWFPSDFRACGDITIRNCEIMHPNSYGIAVSPCDCTLTVDNCRFDCNGLGFLGYATRVIATNCTAILREHYRTMVHSFCWCEMELGGNYVGNKKQNITIKDCNVTGALILGIQHPPQLGVNYGRVEISDCTIDNGRIFVAYNNSDAVTPNYDAIIIRGVTGKNPKHSQWDSIIGLEKVSAGELIIDGIKGHDTPITIRGCTIPEVIIKNTVFADHCNVRMTSTNNIDILRIDGCDFYPVYDQSDNVSYVISEGAVTALVMDNNRAHHKNIARTRFERLECSNLILKTSSEIADPFFNLSQTTEEKLYIFKDCVLLTPMGQWNGLFTNQYAVTGTAILANIIYNTRLTAQGNGMTIKKINCADYTADA